MTIKIIDEPDVTVTRAELALYKHEYENTYAFYAGVPPSLEEYIRRRQQKNIQEHWRNG